MKLQLVLDDGRTLEIADHIERLKLHPQHLQGQRLLRQIEAAIGEFTEDPLWGRLRDEDIPQAPSEAEVREQLRRLGL
jgi:hypothetical protein